MIGILCKAVEHFAVVPFSILLNKENILEEIILIRLFILKLQFIITSHEITCMAF